MIETHTDKKGAFQLGLSIFILLAFFTAAEPEDKKPCQ